MAKKTVIMKQDWKFAHRGIKVVAYQKDQIVECDPTDPVMARFLELGAELGVFHGTAAPAASKIDLDSEELEQPPANKNKGK